MAEVEGSLARRLDFGEVAGGAATPARPQAPLRLASRRRGLAGPDKYRVLERRRRRAQIVARHLLDAMDARG